MSGIKNQRFAQVIDFNQVRELKLAEKRRKHERIFFKHLIQVYSILDFHKRIPIEFLELSESGCSFKVMNHDLSFGVDIFHADLFLRLYFSLDSYLEIKVKVQNSQPVMDSRGDFVRYGCCVDQDFQSYPVYQQFVRFLKIYSENAHQDSVSYRS